jgi:hypothetical protein
VGWPLIHKLALQLDCLKTSLCNEQVGDLKKNIPLKQWLKEMGTKKQKHK